jgi:hypothetical protein
MDIIFQVKFPYIMAAVDMSNIKLTRVFLVRSAATIYAYVHRPESSILNTYAYQLCQSVQVIFKFEVCAAAGYVTL